MARRIPFDPPALVAHPHWNLVKSAYIKPFEQRGSTRVGPHWNSRRGYDRWIYRRLADSSP